MFICLFFIKAVIFNYKVADRDKAHEATMREEQDKIRIKRLLTNNINHELKTPVASMQVCLETLLSGIKLDEEKRPNS